MVPRRVRGGDSPNPIKRGWGRGRGRVWESGSGMVLANPDRTQPVAIPNKVVWNDLCKKLAGDAPSPKQKGCWAVSTTLEDLPSTIGVLGAGIFKSGITGPLYCGGRQQVISAILLYRPPLREALRRGGGVSETIMLGLTHHSPQREIFRTEPTPKG
ncbi:hypothetical protein Pyn_24295 [Prunus yedoensis var. nudiflora]|uniref:Uncharacterized protein n=1 Tax=Prunus yedoensis var. nudiflora TaxID=2094558 RepID=A0A314Y303_PRUYE|nr:hypothetical protein Pyn_24295 [Prunus yedoensis var. nudiflora]